MGDGSDEVMVLCQSAMLHMLVNDTETVREAEAWLKRFLKSIEAAPVLMHLMCNAEDWPVRQMSALFMRRRVNGYWERLPGGPEAREEIKQGLLMRLMSEPERPVRRAIASVVAALAKHLVPAGGWDKLIEFIVNAARHTTSGMLREVAFNLFYLMVDTMGNYFSEDAANLAKLLGDGLADEEMQVKMAALKATVALLSILSNEREVLAYQPLVPVVLGVTEECVKVYEEFAAVDALDCLAELAGSAVPVLNPYVPQVVSFAVDTLMKAELEMSTRDSAGEVISKLLGTRPKPIAKAGLAPMILEACIRIMAEYDPDTDEEGIMAGGSAAATEAAVKAGAALIGGDEPAPSAAQAEAAAGSALYSGTIGNQLTTTEIAECILDKLALQIPNKYIFTAFVEMCSAAASDEDYRVRRAAACTMAVMAEGLQAPLRAQIGDMLGMAFKCAEDPEEHVREMACWTLGQWSQHLKPHIVRYHSDILPRVFSLMNDGSVKVAERGCYVIECFIEAMGKGRIDPYIEPLMVQLHKLLKFDSPRIRSYGVSAMGQAAICAGEAFLPYWEDTASGLLELMAITEEEGMGLRATATDTLGHAAVAVGRAAVEPYLSEAMRLAVEGCALDNNEVKEMSFMFFGSIAKVLGEELGSFVDELVPVLLEACRRKDTFVAVAREGDAEDKMVKHLDRLDLQRDEAEEGSAGDVPEDSSVEDRRERGFHAKAGAGGGAGAGEGEGDGEDEDGEFTATLDSEYMEAGAPVSLRVRTGALNVKAAAVCNLGCLAEFAPAAMAPHITTVMPTLHDMLSYLHEDVRRQAVYAVQELTRAAVAAEGMVDDPEMGQVFQEASGKLVNENVVALMSRIVLDDDKEVVARVCEALGKWLDWFGAVVIAMHLDVLMPQVKKLLQERTLCQRVDSEDEDEEEDDEEDHDHVLMDAVAELLESLAKAFGEAFETLLKQVVKPILRFCKPTRPPNDRGMAVGLWSDFAGAMGEAFAPFLETVLPSIIKGLTDEDAGLRRNSVFSAAVCLCESGDAGKAAVKDALPGIMACLTFKLTPQADGSLGIDEEPASVDNAASAVARLMMTHGDVMDLEAVVPAWLEALPLKADHAEDGSVYECLIAMLDARVAPVMGQMPTVLSVVARALLDEAVADEIKQALAECGRRLAGEFGPAMMEAVSTLPAEQGAVLSHYLSAEAAAAAAAGAAVGGEAAVAPAPAGTA